MSTIDMENQKYTIGFIGQGWIGKHYADDFETRGFTVVRYALEAPYSQNRDQIANCDITFIAVPTPTTPDSFDDSHLRDALGIITPGKIAVIKSTTLPGIVSKLQLEFSDRIILHSPEFLTEKTAAFDAANPNRNIIGIPRDEETYRKAAALILSVLPPAPYQKIMSSMESELVKYAGNCFLYTKVLFMNVLYDTVIKSDADFETVREALVHDPRIGDTHTMPVHDSGRGAGGHCFIKDFEAFRRYTDTILGSPHIHTMLAAMADYNNALLRKSNKDLDLLSGVYGCEVTEKNHHLK